MQHEKENTFIIRHLIREILSNQMTLLYEGENSPGSISRFEDEPYSPDIASQTPADTDLCGKKFAFKKDGEPQVVVVADNKTSKQLLLKRYSTANPDDEEIVTNFGGKQVYPDDPAINQIIAKSSGWKVDDYLYKLLKDQNDSLGAYDKNFEDSYFLVPRDLTKLQRPKIIATRSGQEKVKNFEGIMPLPEAVKTVLDVRGWFSGKIHDKEWALAAASFFSYANSGKQAVLAGLMGAAIGGISSGAAGAETGPGAVATGTSGTLSGLGAGLTWPDVLLRVPVIIWAYANDKKEFFNANLAYCALIIGVELADKSAKIPWVAKLLPTGGKKTAATLVKLAIEFVAQIGAAVNVSLQQQVDAAMIEMYINNIEDLNTVLDKSSAELFTEIREFYPNY